MLDHVPGLERGPKEIFKHMKIVFWAARGPHLGFGPAFGMAGPGHLDLSSKKNLPDIREGIGPIYGLFWPYPT